MKRKFFDTWTAQFAGLRSQEPRVLKYMLDQRDQILTITDLNALVSPIRTILKTPMADLFTRLVMSEQLHNFAAFYAPIKDSIPELLTASSITLDLGQFSNKSVINNIPNLDNKVLVNITSTLRRDRETGELSVNAIDNFQNLFVRGQLVIAYTDLDDWISPNLQEFVIRSYSMILASMVSRYYDLTVPEQMTVALHFALYMGQMLTPGNTEEIAPPILFRCTSLAPRAQLQEVVDMCAEASAQGLTIGKVCELIAQHGPEKMRAFNISALNALCDNLGPDILTSRIALEYPPYWVYILVLALSSSAKIPLIYQLNNQRLMNEGRSAFLNKLFTSTCFSVDRPLR